MANEWWVGGRYLGELISTPREVHRSGQSERPGSDAEVDASDVILVLTSATWDDARRREMCHCADRLAETLLEHPRVRRLLVANPFRSLPIRVVRQAIGPRDEPFPTDARNALHRPLRLRRRDPTHIRALERSYESYDRKLREAAARAGLERPRIICMNPMAAGFGSFDWAEQVTLYASDDWAAAACYRPWWKGIEEAYARIRARGLGVCGVSQAIIERIAPTGRHAVVPNGIKPAQWYQTGSPPDWFTRLPRPRLFYAGALDDRLDVDCLSRLAARFANGSVVLVGRRVDEDGLGRLAAASNVYVRPPVAHEQIPSLVSTAEVCLIPHRRTRLTEAMSPLKLYEYLAAGRPVVATDLPPMRRIDPRVVLVPAGADFSEAVATALEQDPTPEAERRAFIASNSWRARHDRVLDVALP
jgi:glycosyltransferase involved in cell wall biosynthesis